MGSGVILSYLDIHDEVIPDHVVLHGLKQKNGKFRYAGFTEYRTIPRNLCCLAWIWKKEPGNLESAEDELWGKREHTLCCRQNCIRNVTEFRQQ